MAESISGSNHSHYIAYISLLSMNIRGIFQRT